MKEPERGGVPDVAVSPKPCLRVALPTSLGQKGRAVNREARLRILPQARSPAQGREREETTQAKNQWRAPNLGPEPF